jgi:predicted O-methyltransferase YrrM
MSIKFVNATLGKLASIPRVNSYVYKKSDNQILDQTNSFEKLGLDRLKAINKLNDLFMNLFNRNYSENIGMWSEHLVIMAALSDSQYVIKNILEIGTFDGETAQILSKLFPKSKIITIDLPQTSIDNKKIYNYAHKNNQLNTKRNNLLHKCKNVEFRSLNSLNLAYENSKFDLIWVDGAHGYPTIAIDLINSLRMINSGGIVMCDDVYKFSKSSDPEYQSVGAYETLEELRRAGLIDFHLFLKRINKIYNISKFRSKYIGVFQKI